MYFTITNRRFTFVLAGYLYVLCRNFKNTML